MGYRNLINRKEKPSGRMRVMRKGVILTGVLLLLVSESQAALPIAEIIRQGVKKIIVAVDLRIQRMQNETIWLQQAQQKLENVLSENSLKDIADWGERQKELYGKYYDGLWKVKTAIAQYQRIRGIALMQAEMLGSYQKTWNLLVRDGRFTDPEMLLLSQRYGEILLLSSQHLVELTAVLRAYSFQISDGDRLERIHQLDQQMGANFRNLLTLNRQLESINAQRGHWFKEGKVMEGLLK